MTYFGISCATFAMLVMQKTRVESFRPRPLPDAPLQFRMIQHRPFSSQLICTVELVTMLPDIAKDVTR